MIVNASMANEYGVGTLPIVRALFIDIEKSYTSIALCQADGQITGNVYSQKLGKNTTSTQILVLNKNDAFKYMKIQKTFFEFLVML